VEVNSMNFLQKILQKKAFYTNKYFLVTFVFLIFIVIFSQNNLIERIAAIQKRNELLKQKEYYEKTIKENTEKIKELKSNKAMLEKFVREEYLMKKKDEEIYLVVDSAYKKK
jgi:cell division protein FtsB